MLMAAPVDECLQLAYPDVYDLGGTGGSWGTEEAGKVSRRVSGLGFMQSSQTLAAVAVLRKQAR
jgi:hypothetical protein